MARSIKKVTFLVDSKCLHLLLPRTGKLESELEGFWNGQGFWGGMSLLSHDLSDVLIIDSLVCGEFSLFEVWPFQLFKRALKSVCEDFVLIWGF